MRVFVTGASGFIGSEIALFLSQNGEEVYAHRNTSDLPEAVARSCIEVTADLSEKAQVACLSEQLDIDAVVHCAALAQGSECEKNPELARLLNVELSRNIATFFEKSCKQMILLSTDLVFEGAITPAEGHLESSRPEPKSVYAKTKYEAEQVWKSISGANSTIVRVSLCFGEQGVFRWMFNSLKENREITLFKDEWRTPVFVEDIAQASFKLIRSEPADTKTKIYHLAGPDSLSRYEMGLQLAEVFDFQPSLIRAGSRLNYSEQFRAENVSLCSKKTAIDLGLTMTSFKKMLISLKH